MAANVENMFYVRETPWHGLGQRVEEAPTSEDAIRLAGLNWNVKQESVYTNDGILIPGYKANIRDTDNMVLGMVTDRYRIVQNTEAFSFTDTLLGEGVKYETAGSLANGKRVWLLAKLERQMLTGEEVDPYLVFTNSHDGSSAVRVAVTPIRVVCQNTLNLALKNATRMWGCQHKGDMEMKLDEAHRALSNAYHYMDTLKEEFGELKLQSLTDDKVKDYISELIPIDKGMSDRTIIRLKDAREELMHRYLDAPDLQVIEKSAYRFVNAVSDFATHSRPARMTMDFKSNRFMKTIDGNPLIDKAYKIVKAA